MAISQTESYVHLCAAAAISTAMLGVGFGALGLARRVRARPRWAWIFGGCVGSAMTLFVANVELRFDPGGAMLPTAIGVLVGLSVGVPLILVGLRGRRVGDHPHCRRCGFDLTGRPDSSTVCSECGAPLDAPRAIAVGAHERRLLPLLAGAFLAILSVAIGSAITRQTLLRSGGPSFARYEPTSWLIADVAKGLPAEEVSAARELLRRLIADELDAKDATAFVRAATTNLATRPWLATIGPQSAVVAWAGGRLDEATMRAAIRAAVTAKLSLASQSLPDRVPFEITMNGTVALLPPGGGQLPSVEVRHRVDAINGNMVPPASIVGVTPWADPLELTRQPLGGQTPLGRMYRLDDAPLAAGPASVRIDLTLRISLAIRAPITEDVPITLTGTTTIVPSLTRPFASAGNADPLLRATAMAYRNSTPAGTHTFVQVRPSVGNLTFVGDVIERSADGVERTLGPIVIDHGYGEMETAATLADADVTLVLRPTPERGVDFVRTIATYQHDLVIEPARIDRRDRATRQKR